MNHPAKEITFLCAFQTVMGNYLTVPSGGGLVIGSDTSPGKYSTFDYFGDSGLIALDEFPDLYLGCTGDKGYLTTVDRKSAVPFTMPQSGTQDEVVSARRMEGVECAVRLGAAGLLAGLMSRCARSGVMHAVAVRSPAVFSPLVLARRYCPGRRMRNPRARRMSPPRAPAFP